MHDIDFDEIDRAVSSATNNDTETSIAAAMETPVPVLASTPEPPVSVAAVVSPAARRTSGRFMDVVHPSSDMRPSTDVRPPAPSAPSLHREEVIAPADPVSSRPVPAAVASSAFHWPEPIKVAPRQEVSVAAEPEVIAEPVPEVLPEPIVAPVPAPVAEPAVAPVATPAPELVTTPLVLEDILDSPLESPFLNDAKVEKRPLGAFSTSEASAPLYETLDEPQSVEAPAEVIEIPTPETPAEDSPTPVEAATEAPEEELLLEAHTETSHFQEPVVTPDVPAGPTSITQQYKEQPSTDTEPNGAIYDTDAYHQALVHQPKAHHKGLVFVWIAALLLVGGGVGAAVYFFVLPLL